MAFTGSISDFFLAFTGRLTKGGEHIFRGPTEPLLHTHRPFTHVAYMRHFTLLQEPFVEGAPETKRQDFVSNLIRILLTVIVDVGDQLIIFDFFTNFGFPRINK